MSDVLGEVRLTHLTCAPSPPVEPLFVARWHPAPQWATSKCGRRLSERRLLSRLPLKQPPPLPVRLAPRGRLHLHLIAALAGVVRCIAALAHHTFKPMLLGRLEELLAVREGVHQVQAWHLGPTEQPLGALPAFDQL
jgi:hypothetical protein